MKISFKVVFNIVIIYWGFILVGCGVTDQVKIEGNSRSFKCSRDADCDGEEECRRFGCSCVNSRCQPNCEGTQVSCGSQQQCCASLGCFNLSHDVSHCGGCGSACRDGEICIKGVCTGDCQLNEMRCSGGYMHICRESKWVLGEACGGGASCKSEKACGDCKDSESKCVADVESQCVGGVWSHGKACDDGESCDEEGKRCIKVRNTHRVCEEGEVIGEGEDCQCGEGKKDLCGGGNVCVSGACKEKCGEGQVGDCGCGKDDGPYKACGEGNVCKDGKCKAVCEDGQVIGEGEDCQCGKGSEVQDCGGPDNVCVDGQCIRVCDKRELVGDDKQVGKNDECGCPDKKDSSKVKNICESGSICRDGGCEKCDGLSVLQDGRRVCAGVKDGGKSSLRLMECEGKEWKAKETCGAHEYCADTWGCVMGCPEINETCKATADLPEPMQSDFRNRVVKLREEDIQEIGLPAVQVCGKGLGCRKGSECDKGMCKFKKISTNNVCRADESKVFLNKDYDKCSCAGGNDSCELGDVCKSGKCEKVEK